jgi:hypothetical protein
MSAQPVAEQFAVPTALATDAVTDRLAALAIRSALALVAAEEPAEHAA